MANFTELIRDLRKGLINSNTLSDVELKQKRVEVFQERRKNNRDQVLAARRHMVDNNEDVEEAISSTSKKMSRLERLAQWKADRQKKKLEAAKKMKPTFKVCALSTPVGLPDLENINRQIKGKLIVNEKSKFAPKNHQFKPPANIKPIYFDNNTKDKSTKGDLVSKGVKTRAQTTINISTKENITNSNNSLRSTDKRIPLQRKSKKRTHESPKTVGIAVNVQETRQGSPNKRIRTATRAQSKTLNNLPESPANAENIADEEIIKTEQTPPKKQIRSVVKTPSKTSQSSSTLLESIEKIEGTDGTVQEVDESKQQVSRIIKTPKKSSVDNEVREIKQSSSRKRISHITKTPSKASKRSPGLSANVQETEDEDTVEATAQLEETEHTFSKKRVKNVPKTPSKASQSSSTLPESIEEIEDTDGTVQEVDESKQVGRIIKTPKKSRVDDEVREIKQSSSRKRISHITKTPSKASKRSPGSSANVQETVDEDTVEATAEIEETKQIISKKRVKNGTKTPSKASQSSLTLPESIEKIEDTNGIVQEVDESNQQVSRIIKTPNKSRVDDEVRENKQSTSRKRISHITKTPSKASKRSPESSANAQETEDEDTVEATAQIEETKQTISKKRVKNVPKTPNKTSQNSSTLPESIEKIEDTDGIVQEVDESKQVSRIIKTPKKSRVDDEVTEHKQSTSRKRIGYITKTPSKASKRSPESSANAQETEDEDTVEATAQIEETKQTISRKRVKNVAKTPSKTPRSSPNGATKTPKLMEKTTKSKTENNIDDADKDGSVTEIKTPAKSVTNRNEDAPIYISPFVTLSRGKENARKEYAARRARSDLSPNDESSKYTSPAAAASYFTKLLKNYTCRLESLIDEWTEYKASENLSEDAEAMIDVAIGQTNLLIKEKAQQFQQLIDTSVDPDNPEPIRCTDLHGFWDLLFLQISKIFARYENLDKMKSNNWNDFLPEIKKPLSPKRKVVKKQKPVKASSTLRQAILAARKKKQEQEQQSCEMDVEIGGEAPIVVTPGRKTPQRKSLITALQNSETKNRRSSSPGLTMMKITRRSKSFTPHGKGILKDATGKSTGKTKTVIFRDDSNNENNLNVSNHLPDDTAVLRRSSRLSKVKLFD